PHIPVRPRGPRGVRDRSRAHRRRPSRLPGDDRAQRRAARRARRRPRAVNVQIRVARLDPELPLPRQQHTDDAGYDLHAREAVTLASDGGRELVPTGLAVAIPPGCAGFVLPRSGLALQHGVTCLNTPGLIDPLYRGELKVLLV